MFTTDPRTCAGCKVSLEGRHGNARFCPDCALLRTAQRGTAYQQERYADDPEYRERIKARAREWSAEHLELRAKRARERYATDPEYRERMKAKQRDPKTRARVNARNRAKTALLAAADADSREQAIRRQQEWYASAGQEAP